MNKLGRITKIIGFFRIFCIELFRTTIPVKMSTYFSCNGKIIKENWGDDLNYWFLREISKEYIVSYDWSFITRFFKKPSVLGIGSLITFLPIDRTIIWGSGVMSSTSKINGKPLEVRAVRGPLSRKRLMDVGIKCPEVYGDPALLLPRFYKTPVEKKYRLGVILHYSDSVSPYFDALLNDGSVLMIKVRDYNHWLDFVDQINSCEYIISSSLHGLIISEAYSVPNLWIKIYSSREKDDIKFHDFFLSLGKDCEPFIVDRPLTVDEYYETIAQYSPGYIDLQPLYDSCPFTIKDNFQITRG